MFVGGCERLQKGVVAVGRSADRGGGFRKTLFISLSGGLRSGKANTEMFRWRMMRGGGGGEVRGVEGGGRKSHRDAHRDVRLFVLFFCFLMMSIYFFQNEVFQSAMSCSTKCTFFS